MKSLLACCLIVRTSQRLAINGHHSLDGLADSLNPLHETGFKLFRIDERKDSPKRVVRGDAIGQIEQVGKKGFFCFGKFLDLHPSFRSAKDSTDRQNDDIPQPMKFGSFYSWI